MVLQEIREKGVDCTFWLRIGSSEHTNEHSCSIKGGEFPD
jgi:hypothetical protein